MPAQSWWLFGEYRTVPLIWSLLLLIGWRPLDDHMSKT